MVVKKRLVILGSKEYHIDDYVADYERDFDFSVLDAQDRQEVVDKLRDDVALKGPIHALIVRLGTAAFEPFDEELLGSLLPHCAIIASASAGYDEFDVAWMTKHGIWFCNTLDAVSESTADMALFLVLAVLRDAFRAERSFRAGAWRDGLVPTRDPARKTLGIIGMGTIGKHLARKAAAFNMVVVYHNRRKLSEEDEAKLGVTYASLLKELLGQADVISLNCPLTQETTGLISQNEFDLMKDGAVLVNTARGAIVDEDALIRALESGKLAGAGLDAFCGEPNVNEYFLMSDKVVCQPHMGAATTEALRRGEKECLDNIRAWMKTGRPLAPVNHVDPCTL